MKMKRYELVVVSGENCVYCDMTKNLLDDEVMPYRVVDYKTFPIFKDDGHLTVPQLYFYDKTNGKYECLEGGYTALLKTGVEGIKKRMEESVTVS